MSFADGAMDGIAIYHMGRADMDAAAYKRMIRAIKASSDGNADEADALFAELGKTYRAVSIIDDLQKYILTHKKVLSAGNLYWSAIYIARNSTDKESVKFGLSMLELLIFDESDKEVVRRLGLSDEFALFAVWNMVKWDNGNADVFELAQKVSGWGRIHAVERLEPATPEISEWLLLNGIDNTVMAAYSALTVWNSAGVGERLKGQLTETEFHGISAIIRALLDEGPVAGISEVEDREEHLLDYLAQAERFEFDVDDCRTLLALGGWAAQEDVELPAVAAGCADLLSAEEYRDMIDEIMSEADGDGEDD